MFAVAMTSARDGNGGIFRDFHGRVRASNASVKCHHCRHICGPLQ